MEPHVVGSFVSGFFCSASPTYVHQELMPLRGYGTTCLSVHPWWPLEATMKKESISNSLCQVFLWTYVFISFTQTPRSGILGHMIMYVELQEKLSKCFMRWLFHVSLSPEMWVPAVLPSHQHIILSAVPILATQPAGTLSRGVHLHFPGDHGPEHLLMHLSATHVSSLVKRHFKKFLNYLSYYWVVRVLCIF